MLDLTDELAACIQGLLNSEGVFAEWQQLLVSDAFALHHSNESQPYDTTFSEFHRHAGEFVDSRLDQLRWDLIRRRTAGENLLARWLGCVDVFAVTGDSSDRLDNWVRAHVGESPLTAVRIGCTVFYLPGVQGSTWQRRAWQGDDEPLMKLPYQRKYDHERHGRADMLLRSQHEQLRVAYDLLAVLSERLEDLDVSRRFSWPDVDDIESELGRLGLGIGLDDLSGMTGRVSLGLCALRHDESADRPTVDFTVEEGAYRGVLGGYHRRPSGQLRTPPSSASLKWMVSCALTDLQKRLRQIIAGSEHPAAEEA
jgi:hypothetical protein